MTEDAAPLPLQDTEGEPEGQRDSAGISRGEEHDSLSRWLDPTGLRAAILLAVFAAIANGVWIFLDNSTPAWDQAHYLDSTWQYQQGFHAEGVIGMLRAIHSTDPSHGPLFTIFMLPFVAVFGDMARSGLLLNLVLAPILYLAAGEIAMAIFRDARARLLTIVLVATIPLMVGLFHDVLQDFLLTTLATVSVLVLLKTEQFQRRNMSLVLGLVMGLGTLTKVTFPIFIIGPLLVVGVQLASSIWVRSRTDRGAAHAAVRSFGLNIAGAVGVYLLIIFPWYGPNFSATLDYVQSTTGGPLAAGAGPENPYTFHAITSFTSVVLNANVSWIVVLAGIAALGLNFRTLVSWFRSPVRVQALTKAAYLLAWVVIPYLSLALAHNQDVRLMAPAMPGVAVIVAGGLVAVRPFRVRVALIGIVVVALVYQTANRVTELNFNFLPQEARLSVGSQSAAIPLASSQPIGYERLPEDNLGTPIIKYMEAVAGFDTAGGTSTPKTVCLLQTDQVVNGNTLSFLAHTRGDPFVFADIFAGPEGRAGLASALSNCDLALYIRQDPAVVAAADSRVAIVNGEYAAQLMTPKLLKLFKQPSKVFPTSASAAADTQDRRQATGGGEGHAQRVHVLVAR